MTLSDHWYTPCPSFKHSLRRFVALSRKSLLESFLLEKNTEDLPCTTNSLLDPFSFLFCSVSIAMHHPFHLLIRIKRHHHHQRPSTNHRWRAIFSKATENYSIPRCSRDSHRKSSMAWESCARSILIVAISIVQSRLKTPSNTSVSRPVYSMAYRNLANVHFHRHSLAYQNSVKRTERTTRFSRWLSPAFFLAAE